MVILVDEVMEVIIFLTNIFTKAILPYILGSGSVVQGVVLSPAPPWGALLSICSSSSKCWQVPFTTWVLILLAGKSVARVLKVIGHFILVLV